MRNLEEAREFFKNDHYATDVTGAEIIEVGDHYAKTRLSIQPFHRNAMGNVMGGAIFTLADFAFAVASNTEEMSAVSVTNTITYLNSVKGSVLTAEAICDKDGRHTCCYTIHITDDLGTRVAVVTVTGMNVGKPEA